MNIYITCPGWSIPHGGIRIILEWANRLTEWHDVYLYNTQNQKHCSWFQISKKVKLAGRSLRGMDCMIVTSPHSTKFIKRADAPSKIFLFMQMLEHLFQPDDNINWQSQCREFYTAPYPMFSISQWNIDELKNVYKRKSPIHYIGNGVNLEHFPIVREKKRNDIVLVEGWESDNPTKDPDGIAPQVAELLKRDGYRIIAYAGRPLKRYQDVPHEYYLQPSLYVLNKLYERATILLKASKLDARACAPMEAMTKGTVTARAIIKGDDDLLNGINCSRTAYHAGELYLAAKQLLELPNLRAVYAEAGWAHLQSDSWDFWMKKINDILEG